MFVTEKKATVHSTCVNRGNLCLYPHNVCRGSTGIPGVGGWWDNPEVTGKGGALLSNVALKSQGRGVHCYMVLDP